MSKPPLFHNPDRVGTLFHPDIQAIVSAADGAGLTPSDQDDPRIELLLIDMQVDFCHPQGTLYVPGAEDDIRRVLAMLYRYAGSISHITCSLDSHHPHQIFHPAWWVGRDGRHPEPFTIISVDDVTSGMWRPLRSPDWSRTYVQELEKQSRKQLLIWPYHVPIGGPGHMLDPELWSAVFWHALARNSEPTMWRKGSIAETEHYSVLGPEIQVPGRTDPSEGKFMKLLDEFDYILVAGEASSHCVMETLRDITDALRDDPEKLGRIYILRDCTSPVQHPDIDFAAMANDAFREFAARGVNLVNSTDDLPCLPS